MKTVISEGPKANAASVVGTIAPTVRPIADAEKDSMVTIPQNFPNLENQEYEVLLKQAMCMKVHRSKV